ncbi:Pimeloyl-ACP methyl ester carboxylesterase [Roseomonas rosea]|uniref:Pimeloyl-ACP methyl ester carboxylesterase n=1 Tax=Muricoccus roseus TaxID=198092 RepID=A0A1M6N3B1_9PROT|nr:alpha/beta hydrolase [Roseomonas rosea]SHJ90177.1 Pimeloyl-ACP methyl ester carboxylesterase [Roseomonas rosea]
MSEVLSQVLDLPGGAVAWREAGQGPALLLLHGIGGHSGAWSHQLVSLAQRYRVLAWDAPGYGGSEALDEPEPKVADYVNRLESWLDAIDVREWLGVGHSLGAIFLAALAARREPPHRAVLLHPMAGLGGMDAAARESLRAARIAELTALGPRVFAERRADAVLGRGTPSARVERAITVMAEAPVAGYLAAWEALCGADIFPLLDRLGSPTLVISGEEDAGSPPALGQRMAEALLRGESVVMPGVGHYAPIEAPEALDPILLAWLGGPAEPNLRKN